MRPRLRRPRFHPVHLAGWLFADMLLVFVLVSLGDQADPGHAANARPTPTPSMSTSAPPGEAAGPRSVTREPVRVAVDAARGDRDTMLRRLREVTAPYAGREAAFVLTFGRHRDPGPGGEYANEINNLLAVARPDMFRAATTRDFWKGGSSEGHADIEIYFYTY